MKRNIIKVSDYSVTLTGNNIWMTYWEIAEAFNVKGTERSVYKALCPKIG